MKKLIITIISMALGCILALYLLNSCGYLKKTVKNNKTVQKSRIQNPVPPIKVPARRKNPDFVQGLYVTGYTVQTKSFPALLKKASESGINTIIFDAKEMEGDVYFSIKGDSAIQYLEERPLWNLDEVIRLIHQYNMNAEVRIVQFFNIASANKYPFLQPERKGGGYWQEKQGKSTWLDPSRPEVQRNLLRLIERVCQSEADGVQMDYVRFPTEGRLSFAHFSFEKEDQEKVKSDSTWKKREKRDIIAEYIKSVRKVCDQYKMRLTADIFAIVAWQMDVDIRNTGQDIARMTPFLHGLHPMIYSSHFAKNFQYRKDDFYNHPYNLLYEGLNLTRLKTAPGCQVIPYLQAFNWKVNYTQEYVYDQLKAVRDSGCQGFILWHAGNKYDRTLDWLRSWNEQNKWQDIPKKEVKSDLANNS